MVPGCLALKNIKSLLPLDKRMNSVTCYVVFSYAILPHGVIISFNV